MGSCLEPSWKEMTERETMAQVETKMPAIKTHGGKREHAGRPVGSLNKITKPIRALASAFGGEAIKTLVFLFKHPTGSLHGHVTEG